MFYGIFSCNVFFCNMNSKLKFYIKTTELFSPTYTVGIVLPEKRVNDSQLSRELLHRILISL